MDDNGKRARIMELEMLQSLNEFKIKLEAYLKEKFGNDSLIKTCSLSKIIFSILKAFHNYNDFNKT